MAGISGVAQAASIIEILTSILVTGQSLDLLSKRCVEEIAMLRAQVDRTLGKIRTFSPDDSVNIVLRRAQTDLREEELRLKFLEEGPEDYHCGCGAIFLGYVVLNEKLFPTSTKLEKIVSRTREEINKVLPPSIPLTGTLTVPRFPYVPIQRSADEVRKALEDVDGPSIVLLHGGVGTGKSTLARHMCALYEHEKNEKFDYAIIVICPGNPDPVVKQIEILQLLAPSKIALLEGQSNVKTVISRNFQDVLVNLKILIVLDDVSDERFLYEMWKAANRATRVKYLVTSQKANLCLSLTEYSVRIRMSEPNLEEARRILGSLVGLESGGIPPHLQGIADKMVEATEGNPLALACLASSFSFGEDKLNRRAWQDAYSQFTRLLHQSETKIVLGPDLETPRSFHSAMTLSLDSLSSNAKILLFLLCACIESPIPEEVLRVLYFETNPESSFGRSKDELSSRQLFRISPGSINEESRSWSLSKLFRLYMDVNLARRADFAFVVSTFQREEEESEYQVQKKVGIALCALYFDPDHKDRNVNKLVAWARNVCNIVLDNYLINQRRKVVEPMIWLLDQPEDDEYEWTESNINCARQVFLKYVCEGQLDGESISVLLQLTSFPEAPWATLTAITHIWETENAPLLNEANLIFLTPLAHFLDFDKSGDIKIVKAAFGALRSISSRAATGKFSLLIVNTPGILASLIRAILDSREDNLEVDVVAIRTLGSLACGEDLVKMKILDEYLGLRCLVRSLYKNNISLQEGAARALANLARTEDQEIKQRMRGEDELLTGLRDLSEHKDPDLQNQAEEALENLGEVKGRAGEDRYNEIRPVDRDEDT